MTFKSDAHRRWWFANRGNAGGGGGPANFSSRDLKREKDWEMVQENGRWVEKDPVVRALVEENETGLRARVEARSAEACDPGSRPYCSP